MNGARVWDVLFKFMVPVTLAVGSVVVRQEVRDARHDERLAAIEATRFTNKHGIELERRLLQQLPPQWLRDDITEIKDDLKILRHTHLDIQRRITSLESEIKRD